MSSVSDDIETGRLVVSPDDEDNRYHRQSLISWWDQERLAAAHVLVVGAGALGNELIKNVALLGVGRVTVIDLDVVENSNLSRCVLFRESDEGLPKAEVVCRAARQLNPEISFVSIVGDVRTGLGLGAYRDFDVVLGGLDNREARLHVNQACWKAGTPWIDGAIEGLMGVARAFVPPASACYECTLSDRDYELLAARKACSLLTREEMLTGKVPTTATSGSVIAAMQVQEAVKLLHADVMPYEFAGQGVAFNGLTHDSYVVTYPRRDDCMSHDSYNLASATKVAATSTLAEILELGSVELGGDVVLDLECDVLVAMSCPACATREAVGLPTVRVHADRAICPDCGEERQLEATHTLAAGHELLSHTPLTLQLPAQEVITARSLTERHHYIVAAGSGHSAVGEAT